MTRPPLTPALLATRVMAILRGPDPSEVERLAHILVEGGIRCLEVTLTTPRALDLVGQLRVDLPPSVTIGAGTVITVAQARDAVNAGAEFLVSPSTDAEVIGVGLANETPCYPGAWTPTEIVEAWRSGACAVKLFPAVTGGPAYLRQVRQPLPDIPLIAVGGVDPDNAREYLCAGAVAVGIGSGLAGGSNAAREPHAIRQRVQELLAVAAEETA
jgi:2-dehydro-3-deoxyphosphogluconate aldolase/(4S)-4-hydroxy-2-oxoglutarate aldolase